MATQMLLARQPISKLNDRTQEQRLHNHDLKSLCGRHCKSKWRCCSKRTAIPRILSSERNDQLTGDASPLAASTSGPIFLLPVLHANLRELLLQILQEIEGDDEWNSCALPSGASCMLPESGGQSTRSSRCGNFQF